MIYVNVVNPINSLEFCAAYGTMFEFIRTQAEMRRSGRDDLKRVDVIPELAPLHGEPVLFNGFLGVFYPFMPERFTESQGECRNYSVLFIA